MSSSESEDENLDKLMEATDPSLFNDAMFCDSSPVKSSRLDRTNRDIPRPVDVPVSNRYLNEEESAFHSDLNVTESMKKFIGKKMSTLIENNFTFVQCDVQPLNHKSRAAISCGIKLLRGFEEDLKVSNVAENVSVKRQIGTPIKRRTVEDDFAISENEKFDQVVFNVDSISKSTTCWTNRPKSKLYEYRQTGKSKVPTLKITDEFSAARQKNNWEDSKIKGFHHNLSPRIGTAYSENAPSLRDLSTESVGKLPDRASPGIRQCDRAASKT